MNTTQWILATVICVGWFGLVFWLRRYSRRKMAEIGKAEEFKLNKRRANAVLFPVFGLAIMVMIAFKWSSLPPGNEPIALTIMAIGVLFILYGLLRWYQVRRR